MALDDARETAKEHSESNLKKVGKKAYQTSKESSNQNHKNVIISLYKHLYLGILKGFWMSNIYKQGEHRKQQMFFPPSIDEYVSENNTVRVIRYGRVRIY